MASGKEWVLLDTSAWIGAFRGSSEALSKRVQELLADDRVAICGPVVFEIRRGLRPKEQKTVLPLFEALHFLPFAEEDWAAAGSLDVTLRQKGLTLPAMDLLIATLCQRHQVTLLTLDQHFSMVPKLKALFPGVEPD